MLAEGDPTTAVFAASYFDQLPYSGPCSKSRRLPRPSEALTDRTGTPRGGYGPSRVHGVEVARRCGRHART